MWADSLDCTNSSDPDSDEPEPDYELEAAFRLLRFGRSGWGFQKPWATPEQREEAIERMASGKETREKISADLGFSTNTLSRWWKQHNRDLEAPKTKQCRKAPVKTTPEQDRALMEVVNDHPGMTLRAAMNLAEFPASKATAMKRLRDAAKADNDDDGEASKRPRVKTIKDYFIHGK